MVFKRHMIRSKEPVRFFGQVLCYDRTMKKIKEQEAVMMKGYYTANGYFGLVDGSYILFSDESDYYDFMDQESDAA